MGKLSQTRAPIYEALERFRRDRVVPFDVPGHKHGRGNPELVQLLGERCVSIDVNSMKPLDNLCHPVSVIKEAEELAADAFGASHAFLMVGGTTSAVQTMILACCKKGDKIILPRNVHRSAINAMVLCGAKPVYVNPDVDQRLGISLGMKREDVIQAIEKEIQRLQATRAQSAETHEKLGDLLKRPEYTYENLREMDPERPQLSEEVTEQVEIQLKYEGYITRQLHQIERFKSLEAKKLPADLPYESIQGLRIEAKQKLMAVRPVSMGQASRISGVSPADLNVLMVYLEQRRRTKATSQQEERKV